jgi:putative transcriptional regulator
MVRVNLAIVLAKRKMKVSDLSRITNIRYNTLSDLYHEFAERVSLEHINLICKALDCTVADLIEYIPDKK